MDPVDPDPQFYFAPKTILNRKYASFRYHF